MFTTFMGVVLACWAWTGSGANNEVSGNGTWWTIVSAMGTFIGIQFAFIRKLSGDLKECQESRISSLEEKLKMIRSVKKEMD